MAVSFIRSHTAVSIKTAGTTNIGVNISTATTRGNVLIARILFDNFSTASTPTVSSIGKAAGETANWVLLGAARSTSTSAGAFSSGELWAIHTTVSWPVASYTVTLSNSVTMKATFTEEFSGATATLRSTVGTAYSTSTTAASATTTGTTPVTGDLVIGYIFSSNTATTSGAGDTDTSGGTWSTAVGFGSSGSSGATNNAGAGQYKILTSGVHQTYNLSVALTAGNGSIVAVLQANATSPTVSSFTASSSTVVIGSTVTFTDTSTNTPTGWAWNFGTGASPATATTQGPHVVTYSTLGTSNVTLTATNVSGGTTTAPTAITVTRAPLATLIDGFDSGVNTSLWVPSGGTIQWDAALGAKFPLGTLDSDVVLTTGFDYTLVGSSIYAKATLVPTTLINNCVVRLSVQDASVHGAFIEIAETASLNYKLSFSVNNDVLSDVDTFIDPYDPVAHAWWRIRESGGTVYFDTSPDGSTWTQRHSGAWDSVLSAVQVELYTDKGDGLNGAYAYFDNINIVPAVPAITQAAYQFYGDGTEAGSTAAAAQDASAGIDVTGGDVNGQIRMRLQSTSAVAIDSTDDFQLQWEKNTSGTWRDVVTAVGTEALLDSYSEVNADTTRSLVSGGSNFAGQSFVGNDQKLSRAGFYVLRVDANAGNVYAHLYAHDGTFGAGTAVPIGSPLATSAAVSILTFSTSAAWQYFTFDDSYTLVNGTPYFIVIEYSGAANTVNVRLDGSSPTHAGTSTNKTAAGAWNASTTQDAIFQVYSKPIVAVDTIAPYDSPSLTNGAATTNRLTGGTGTFTAGKVSEDGLADNVGWSGNNFTEVLYSITLKQADLANADTIRFRVLRNGVTTEMTYTQYPTITIIKSGAAPIVPRNIRVGNAALQRSFTR